jgi:hypothetical protein
MEFTRLSFSTLIQFSFYILFPRPEDKHHHPDTANYVSCTEISLAN